MGESTLQNGSIIDPGAAHRGPRSAGIPVYENVRLQNAEGVTMLMIGDRVPYGAIALTPPQARELAEALLRHAEVLPDEERPGPDPALPPPDPAPAPDAPPSPES